MSTPTDDAKDDAKDDTKGVTDQLIDSWCARYYGDGWLASPDEAPEVRRDRAKHALSRPTKKRIANLCKGGKSAAEARLELAPNHEKIVAWLARRKKAADARADAAIELTVQKNHVRVHGMFELVDKAEYTFVEYEHKACGQAAVHMLHGGTIDTSDVTTGVTVPPMCADPPNDPPNWLDRVSTTTRMKAVGGSGSEGGGALFKIVATIRKLRAQNSWDALQDWRCAFASFRKCVAGMLDLPGANTNTVVSTHRAHCIEIIRDFTKLMRTHWNELFSVLLALFASDLAVRIAALWHRCPVDPSGYAQSTTVNRPGVYAAFGRPMELQFLKRGHVLHKAQTSFPPPEALPKAECHYLPDTTRCDCKEYAHGVDDTGMISAVPIIADIIDFLGTLSDARVLRGRFTGLVAAMANMGQTVQFVEGLRSRFKNMGGPNELMRLAVTGTDSLRSHVASCVEGQGGDAYALHCVEPRMRSSDEERFTVKRCSAQPARVAETAPPAKAQRLPQLWAAVCRPDVLNGLGAEVNAARVECGRHREARVDIVRRLRWYIRVDEQLRATKPKWTATERDALLLGYSDEGAPAGDVDVLLDAVERRTQAAVRMAVEERKRDFFAPFAPMPDWEAIKTKDGAAVAARFAECREALKNATLQAK